MDNGVGLVNRADVGGRVIKRVPLLPVIGVREELEDLGRRLRDVALHLD